MNKWDERFLDLAKHVSAWSKDPSTKVGAVITRGNEIVSMGYNGFPSGVEDNERLFNRETKYDIIIHAEINAILHAKQNLDGCTIYVWPLPPCPRCAAVIIQSGIDRVVSPACEEGSRWSSACNTAKSMFEEAGVVYFNSSGNGSLSSS